VNGFTGYDMLQGFFIVAVVNIAGLNAAFGELIVTGFGVMASSAFVDVLLDIDDALGVQVVIDIDAKRRQHVVQTQRINFAGKVFTKFHADDDIVHNHICHAQDDVKHEQGKKAADNYSKNIHQNMLIHYFFYMLDIGQVACIFINLHDFMRPTV